MASAFAGMEDSLSCSVCFVKYDSDSHVPKTLPCQHTFCGSCISHVISRADEGPARCPMCRKAIRSQADARTNLAVRDIVEALAKQTLAAAAAAQPRAREDKMACAVHAGAEYIMFCAHCCSPLCAHCMRLELKKGSHQGHDIQDIQEAKATIKRQFTSLVQQNIGKLKEKSSMLRSNMETYQKEVDTVTSLMTEAIEGWRKDMLQDVPDKTKKADEIDRDASYWHQQLKLTEFGDILKAFRDAKSDRSADAEMAPPKMTQASIQQLMQSVEVLCETFESSLKQQATLPGPKQKGDGRGRQGTDQMQQLAGGFAQHRGGIRSQHSPMYHPQRERSNPDQCPVARKSPSFKSLRGELQEYGNIIRFMSGLRLKEVTGDVLAAPPDFTLVFRVGEISNTGKYRLLDYDMEQCPVHTIYFGCDKRFCDFHMLWLYGSFICIGCCVQSSPCESRSGRTASTYYIKSSSTADIQAGLEKLKDSCLRDGTTDLAMPAFRDHRNRPQATRRIIEQVFADTDFTIVLFHPN